MKKNITRIIFGVLLASKACAQLPTIDIAHIASDEISWIENAASWATSAANQETQITNQVTQIQQVITQLKRMGDPATLVGALGISGLKNNNVGVLDPFQKLIQSADGNQAITRYGLQQSTYNGASVSLDPNSFRQAALLGKITDEYAQNAAGNATTRASLEAQFKQTLSDLDNATDDATVARLNTKLQGLTEQKRALDAADQSAAAASTITTNDIMVGRKAAEEAAAAQLDAQYKSDMQTATQGQFTPLKGFEPIKAQ
jgi:hypothetical protein